MIFDFKSSKNALTRLFLYISRIVRDFAKKEEDLEARETCLIKNYFSRTAQFRWNNEEFIIQERFYRSKRQILIWIL